MINIILAGCTFFIFLFFYQILIKYVFFRVNKSTCENNNTNSPSNTSSSGIPSSDNNLSNQNL